MSQKWRLPDFWNEKKLIISKFTKQDFTSVFLFKKSKWLFLYKIHVVPIIWYQFWVIYIIFGSKNGYFLIFSSYFPPKNHRHLQITCYYTRLMLISLHIIVAWTCPDKNNYGECQASILNNTYKAPIFVLFCSLY